MSVEFLISHDYSLPAGDRQTNVDDIASRYITITIIISSAVTSLLLPP